MSTKENKQTIHFDFEYFQGYTCVGCAMIEDLAIEVEFTDDEITLMKQLICQIDETDYSEGIMPVLKDAAPELYKRIDDAARSEMFDFYVDDHVTLEDNPDYTVDIPVEFLPSN